MCALPQVRLLARADTGAPVLLVDQPIYSPHITTGTDAAGDAARRAQLDRALLSQSNELGMQLALPVVPWTRCTAPSTSGAAAEGAVPDDCVAVGSGSVTDHAVAATAAQRRVALIEHDGLAPQVYSNLRGRLVRGTAEARGTASATKESDALIAMSPPRVDADQCAMDEPTIVHALALMRHVT